MQWEKIVSELVAVSIKMWVARCGVGDAKSELVLALLFRRL